VGVIGPAAGIALSVFCSPQPARGKDNVVLIIIDTIRPDRLGCYGYPLSTSPNIDALASRGTLFEQAVTCAPVTLPSVSAMLTSTYPVSNNVRYNGKFFLNASSVTLAEILKQNGYRTAAFVGGFPLDSRFKLDQGFDLYDDDFTGSAEKRKRTWIGHGVGDFERTAGEVNEKVFDWLEHVEDEKFFLMVHYFDPHMPYEPPGEHVKKFDDPYNAEVTYTDEQVGKLLAKLEQLGLKKNTLVVLTGDHGESLGAHGEPTHGNFLFDTTVLIPLILNRDDRIPAGRRIEKMVRSIDIAPTILDYLGIDDDSSAQGVSLLPALDGNFEESPILLETMLPYYESEDLGDIPVKLIGLRTGEWKLVFVTMERDGKPGWMAELYHVSKEPLELFDVKEQNEDVFNRMMNEMHSMVQAYLAKGVPRNNRIEMDKETREKLKSLGYLK
jgi:arylsulfatase A-like enzyme